MDRMDRKLRTEVDCSEALLRLGQLELLHQELATEYERRQKEVKEEAERRMDPVVIQKAALLKAIRAFAEEHQVEIETGGARSKKLFWGTIGWVASMKLKPLGHRTFAHVLEMLWDAGKRRWIRVTRELDKEGLKRWGADHPDELREMGMALKPFDNFYAKPDLAEIANYKPAA